MIAEFDNGAPSWSPRLATEAEQRKVGEVREMQARVRRQLGDRKEPSSQDMKAILTGMGGGWVDKLPVYQLAVSTVDQSVR